MLVLLLGANALSALYGVLYFVHSVKARKPAAAVAVLAPILLVLAVSVAVYYTCTYAS